MLNIYSTIYEHLTNTYYMTETLIGTGDAWRGRGWGKKLKLAIYRQKLSVINKRGK